MSLGIPLAALALSAFAPVAEAQMNVTARAWQFGPRIEPPALTPVVNFCGRGRIQPRALRAPGIGSGAHDAAEAFLRTRYPGVGAELRVARVLNQLVWQDSLEQARQQAQRSGKPILWIQALGDLRGYT